MFCSDPLCSDKYDECAAWSAKNQCIVNKEFMEGACAKTCGSCLPARGNVTLFWLQNIVKNVLRMISLNEENNSNGEECFKEKRRLASRSLPIKTRMEELEDKSINLKRNGLEEIMIGQSSRTPNSCWECMR